MREILADEFPVRAASHKAKYEDVYEDLRLRLADAGERFGFAVEVPDPATARAVCIGVAQLFSRRCGKGVVELVTGQVEGRPAFFIRRGPNWK